MDMYNLTEKVAQARARLKPPKDDGGAGEGGRPSNGKWKSFKCPYCGKSGAGLFEHDGSG